MLSKAAPRKRAYSSTETSDEERQTPPRAKKARIKRNKTGINNGIGSLTKKEIGDRVKGSLALQKYHIPRMRFETDMDLIFFRTFFVDNEALTKPAKPVPEEFDGESPVITLQLTGDQAGEILGVSKVKGGNRMATVYLDAMCILFSPAWRKATVWLTV